MMLDEMVNNNVKWSPKWIWWMYYHLIYLSYMVCVGGGGVVKISLLRKCQYNTSNSLRIMAWYTTETMSLEGWLEVGIQSELAFSLDSGWPNLTNFQLCSKALIMHIHLTVCFKCLFFPGLGICANTLLCNTQQQEWSEAPDHVSRWIYC